jgi:4-hydroxy 2-oxovalerate aldolase
MRLIDCTLRDGGYHNSWNFSKKFAEETIHNLVTSGVTSIEIGFRKPKTIEKLGEGIFANLDPVRLQKLQIPSDAKIGIMINASDYFKNSMISIDLIKDSFPFPEEAIKFIRIAADKEDITGLAETKNYLENLGYEVHLNLMKINNLFTGQTLSKFADKAMKDIESLEFRYLTLADTYGVMRQSELKNLIQQFLQIKEIKIGLHMHNNLGLATSNSILGIDLGVSMLDSTLSGMGRGPGNLRTEFIVDEISHRTNAYNYDSNRLLNFTAQAFEPLKEHYRWGESAYYNLGAKNLIHPSYIQNLTQKDDYSATEILEAINILGSKNQIHYSEKTLNFVLNEQVETSNYDDSQVLSAFSRGGPVIILGAGNSLRSMRPDELQNLKENEGEVFISMSLRPFVDRMLVDAYAILDPVKYFIDYKIVESHQSIIVSPFKLRREFHSSPLNAVFTFVIEEDSLDLNQKGAVLPFPSSLGYTLMSLVASKVTDIKLVGFDGFEEDDPRQNQNQRILDLFEAKFGEKHKITFLTPTRYILKR